MKKSRSENIFGAGRIDRSFDLPKNISNNRITRILTRKN